MEKRTYASADVPSTAKLAECTLEALRNHGGHANSGDIRKYVIKKFEMPPELVALTFRGKRRINVLNYRLTNVRTKLKERGLIHNPIRGSGIWLLDQAARNNVESSHDLSPLGIQPPPVSDPEGERATLDINWERPNESAGAVRNQGTSPGRVDVLDGLHFLPESRLVRQNHDVGHVGINEQTLAIGRTLRMDTDISRRIGDLVQDFEIYTGQEMHFGDWAWNIHRETVMFRRQFSSVKDAIHSDDFIVRHVGHTLVAWGMDGQAARLVPPAEFHSRIKECEPRLSSWKPYSTSGLVSESLARDLLDTFKALGLSKTNSQVVTASKRVFPKDMS